MSKTLYPVPAEWRARAYVDAQGYADAYAQSLTDPDAYWRKEAARLDWMTPFTQVKDTSFFGVDPGSTAFGAHVFSVDGGKDPRTGLDLLGSTGHDEYFVRGSESLRNLALISLGRGFLVTTDDPGSIAPKGYAGLHRGGR